MTIRSHPHPSTLIAHAAGNLPGALAGVVASHISMCPQCQRDMHRLEAVGMLLLERIEADASEAGIDTLVRRAIQRGSRAPFGTAERPRDIAKDEILPYPLARYLGMGIDDIPWQRLPKGIKQYWLKLPEDAGLMRILRIPPRVKLLEHSHLGHEVTLILKGIYSDHTGDYYPGDVTEMDETMDHQPAISGDEECICVVASEQPPRYSRWYARMIQPILGY